MNVGLLILRLLLGGLLLGHSMQKMVGWFGGLGPAGTGAIFEKWGLRPGKQLVVVAATCELVATTLLVLGLLVPVGSAIAVGTLLVAVSVTAPNGVWAQKGGFELPLVYAGIAAALAFTGPGAASLDHAIGLDGFAGVVWGIAAVIVGLVAALAVSAYTIRNRRAPAQADKAATKS